MEILSESLYNQLFFSTIHDNSMYSTHLLYLLQYMMRMFFPTSSPKKLGSPYNHA
jgi:hypothetical protein